MPETSLILLADDDENHIHLVRKAFEKAHILNPLQVVRDGRQVIAYLRGDGLYSSRTEFPLPSLLLLDLKMPGTNGFEVLEWIRSQPTLCRLRVVVLTCSQAMSDVNRAYQLGANSFLTKPADFDDFVAVMRALQGYWIWMSEAPEITRAEPKVRAANESAGFRESGAPE